MLKVTDKKNGTVPEGYQLTSIGIIPLDWDLKPLGMIADEITQTAGTAMYETVSISAGIGFVNQAKKFGKELSGNQYEKYIVLHKGDFSYNKGNSHKYPQGCIYRLTDREKAAVPNVFESFCIKDGVADYFEQLFISGFLNRQLYAKINHGVRDNGLLNLTGKDFYSCMVPFPPIKEQKKIAEILIQYDKIINLRKCKLMKVIELKKACMEKMFPEQGKMIPEIRFPGFSDTWEQRKLGEVGKARSGVGFPESEQGGTCGTPFFKVSDMNADGNENEMTTANNYVTTAQIMGHRWSPIEEVPAIFFAKVGAAVMLNRKRLCRFPFLLDNNTMAYSLTKSSWDADFAKALFETVDLTSLVQVGALPSYNAGDVEAMEIALPNLPEQRQIGTFFRHLDNLITLYQRELDEMVRMKKALMQQLLTGKVQVKI